MACASPSSTRARASPMLLIHGFASSVRYNWIEPGWVSLLTRNGFRVIAFDNRGHGESEKLYDAAAYSAPLMAEDARRLLDHLAHPARRRDGLLDGRAHHRVPGARASRARAQRHLRRARRQHGAADGRHGPDRRTRWRPPASTTSRTRPRAPSAPSPSRPAATSRRWPPASARSREPLTREMVARLDCPVLVATGTRGRDRRLGRGAGRADPGRRSAADPQARPHAGGRRPRLQGGRAGISCAAVREREPMPMTRAVQAPQSRLRHASSGTASPGRA